MHSLPGLTELSHPAGIWNAALASEGKLVGIQHSHLPALILSIYHSGAAGNSQSCIKAHKVLPDATFVTTGEFALKYRFFPFFQVPKQGWIHPLERASWRENQVCSPPSPGWSLQGELKHIFLWQSDLPRSSSKHTHFPVTIRLLNWGDRKARDAPWKLKGSLKIQKKQLAAVS